MNMRLLGLSFLTLSLSTLIAGAGCGDDGEASGGGTSTGQGAGTNTGAGGTGGTATGNGGGMTGGGGTGGGVIPTTAANCNPAEGAEGTLSLTEVASGFSVPMMVTYAYGDDERLYVVERAGTVQLLKNGQPSGTFLDISGLMLPQNQWDSEEGFLGLAFHPDYANNGRFWVHYSAAGGDDHLNAIQEFQRDPNNPDLADPNPVGQPLTADQPFPNHNGGHIEFNPVDGLLYIGIGDGGSSGDPQNNGVDSTNLLGTLLRVDVSTVGSFIDPPGNAPGGDPKVFDWGLRNPYRWSFDICTGDRYIADVGQNQWEEVDVAPPTQGPTNWGWDCREGAHDFNNSAPGCPFGDEVDPAWEYQHLGGGRSITGGYVYRGSEIPWLRGWYLFGDFVTGEVWRFQWDGGNVTNAVPVADIGNQRLTGFGQDNQGEVYLTDAGAGAVFKFTSP